MPCFKGLAVSIHSDGPLSEYSIQRQSRASRITSYIPVPPPKISHETGLPEQSSFCISITLLTPGLSVPYSTPKPSPEEPYPRPQIVAGLPGISSERGRFTNSVTPYESLTSSANETIAAYIYFDGRQKEEVATLLRRGEETWVNSRWVSVPESEGGGLAERDFLFREVGLERWLNGLDLEGKDVAAKVERRRQRMEKKRRKRRSSPDSGEEDGPAQWRQRNRRADKGVLRYGEDDRAPLEKLSDEDEDLSSDEESDDDPIPEATGQIKVALFRVLASGEIKKGEYSPQFDAHDDDDDLKGEGGNGESGQADIDHTTSFAKPKSLDPKSISTQTVTGIDGPDRPYAVFTFLYRGEKQLQKMGILKSKKPNTAQEASSTSKRRSVQTDFANLKPLQPGGTIGFTGIRDEASPARRNGKARSVDDMDSDEEEDDGAAAARGEGGAGGGGGEKLGADADADEFKNSTLSPEELRKQGELADGVKKIKLKRQHSFEPPFPPDASSSSNLSAKKSPTRATANATTGGTTTTSGGTTTALTPSSASRGPTDSPPPAPLLSSAAYDPGAEAKAADSALVGSPLKKQRASMSGIDSEFRKSSSEALAKGLGFGFSSSSGGGSGSGGLGALGGLGSLGASGVKGEESESKGEFGAELRRPAPTSAGILGMGMGMGSLGEGSNLSSSTSVNAGVSGVNAGVGTGVGTGAALAVGDLPGLGGGGIKREIKEDGMEEEL